MSELPYDRGELLRSTEDDFAKLRLAWRVIAERHAAGTVFNFTGLERSMGTELDDELAPALHGERLRELALDHLGGDPERDDVFVANRMTAAIFCAVQALARSGSTVVGVSAGYSHPSVVRAVRFAGAKLVDTVGLDGFAARVDEADVVVLTRLAVTYEALPAEELSPIVELARERGVPVFVDDAGGARVGPAILGQPKTLELGAEVGATGLDKYGTLGPRLGLLAGRSEIVASIRARAIELGMEARPMLYPAVVASLEQYRPERVRELVASTQRVGDALERIAPWLDRTPVAVKLPGAGILAEAARRAGIAAPALVPIEATAALAMLLLRDHGILTVHFAALPPGTDALLLKFIPPEVLERFGGPDAFAAAVDAALDGVAELLGRPAELRSLLGRE